MSRTKGSKNKPKEVVPVFAEEKGNPDFNITDVEPTEVLTAQGAMTEEDYELDRELERMAQDTPPVAIFDDVEPPAVTHEKIMYSLLSGEIDCQPAATLRDLDEQVLMAKEHECDSIEATDIIVKHFCRKEFPPKAGFFFYKDIRVFQAGRVEEAIGLDKRTTREFDVKGPISARGARSV